MQLIGVYFVRTLENYFKNDFISSRNKQVTLIAGFVESYLLANTNEQTLQIDGKKVNTEVNEIINNLIAINNAEVQIIDVNGIIISTSSTQDQSIVGQKNTQNEVVRALQGIRDNERMFTDSDGYRKLVIAQPVGSGVRVLGAVYIVASMEELYATMNNINQILISGTLIALIFTAVLGAILSNTITKPIKEITNQVTAVAEGNFEQEVFVRGKDEIGQLGQKFNYMTNRLKEALAINEEERDKLTSILRNMNDGVIATDHQGKVILINRKAEELFKLNQYQTNIQYIHPSLTLPTTSSLMQSGNHHAQVYLEIKHSEEETITVKVNFTSIQKRSNGETGWIAVLQDVTEQQKLEQTRKEFVANVSHELRTPLTTLKSYLEALDDGAINQPNISERFVKVAKSETERMIRLVSDLLHLSRLDSKQALMNKKLTQVTEMIEEIADRFSFQLKQKNISMETKVLPENIKVILDRDKIEQVLDNLISNSLKYTSNGGLIKIFAQSVNDKWLEVSVADDGIGIPKKDISRIFERFYRVEKARSRNMGGTGLGLSIAREIIKAHRGDIQLESELGKGTKVTFSIPILFSESGES